MRAWVFSTITAIVGFAAAPTWAASVRDKVELNWVAPEPCPKKDEFLAVLTRMLADRVTIDENLLADVVIAQPSGGSFQLQLTTKLGRASGRRVLRGRACRVVADAAAVTLALLLNPDLEVAMPEPTDDTPNANDTPAPEVPPQPKPAVRERVPRTDETRLTRWHGLLASHLGVLWGALPRANPQLTLAVGLGRERGSLWATGSYSTPQNATIAPLNVGGRLWTASLGVAGCWLWTYRSPRLGNCLGAEVTRLYGHGTGVLNARSASTTWISPSLSAHGDFALSGDVWFRLAASGMLPLARPDTHLDDVGTVQRPAIILGRLDAGVVVSF